MITRRLCNIFSTERAGPRFPVFFSGSRENLPLVTPLPHGPCGHKIFCVGRKGAPLARSLIRLHNVRVPFGAPEDAIRAAAAGKVGIAPAQLGDFRIVRRSLDARAAPRVFEVYAVEFTGEESLIEGLPPNEAAVAAPAEYAPPESGDERLPGAPLVVGAGPAGLFAAMTLAENGYGPLIVERGKPVEARSADVRSLSAGGAVDPDSNLLFGEGGAGAFSDGKLTTRISDPHIALVLETLVRCGAPESILIDARPHIGSDLLPGVVANIHRRIEAAGGRFRFGFRVEGLVLDEGGGAAGVRASGGEEIDAGAVILAAGNWADELIARLHEEGTAIEGKPFQMGVRIEHPQRIIDRAVYRGARGDLPPAEYVFSARPGGARGVATFCMCPGGVIVPAVARERRLAVNGASPAARDGSFANAALVVTVKPEDCPGGGPLAGLAFQQALERAAFEVAGDYRAPAQRATDFTAGRRSARLPECSYPLGIVSHELGKLLPRFLTDALRKALPEFDRRLPGFIEHGLLVAVETRASSAVRILRDHRTHESLSTPRLYPAGEGAGYAGGIMSSAVDGIRTAQLIIRRFAPSR